MLIDILLAIIPTIPAILAAISSRGNRKRLVEMANGTSALRQCPQCNHTFWTKK